MPTLLNCGALCDNIIPNYCVHFVCTLPLAEIYGIVHIKQQIISKGKDDKKMNKAQSKSKLTKVLSLILALVMVLSLMPLMGAANSSDSSVLENRAVLLDCGRKYFSVSEIEKLIDGMSAAGYNQLTLAFGNAGLRFLLNDMSLSFTVDGKTVTYDSDTMEKCIKTGNSTQNNSGDESTLSQNDMDTIITYAEKKNVEIIPLLNMPGHMNAVLNSFENYRIQGNDMDNNKKRSSSTLDLTNDEARAFGLALLQKYVDYFKNKTSVKHFNFGADEVGNDIVNPFYGYNNGYENCVSYINACAEIIVNAGMTPRAFNDFMYYNNSSSTFNSAIEVCYWNNQWSNSPYVDASTIAAKGHKLINTNSEWYYVLGVTSSGSSSQDNNLTYALKNVESIAYNQYHVIKGNSTTQTANTAGTMLCIWCDNPNASKAETAIDDGIKLLKAFATKNASVFPTSSESVNPTDDPADSTEASSQVTVNLTVGQTSDVYTHNGAASVSNGDETVASKSSTTTASSKTTGTVISSSTLSKLNDGESVTGVIYDGSRYMTMSETSLSYTNDSNKATVFTVTKESNNNYTNYTISCVIGGSTYYVARNGSNFNSGSGANNGLSLVVANETKTYAKWQYDGTKFYVTSGSKNYFIRYSSNGWAAKSETSKNNSYALPYSVNEVVGSTQISFTGVAPGDVSYTVTDGSGTATIYNIHVVKANYTQTINLTTDASIELTASLSPAVADDTTVTYEVSSGSEYVSLNGSTVTGNNIGAAVITATAKNSAGVEIATYTLTVNVSDVDWKSITPVTVNYFITNIPVTADSKTSESIEADSVYSENGADVSTLIPQTGTNSQGAEVKFWKAMYQTSSEIQTQAGWTNTSNNGIEIEKLRYWDGSWAYYSNGTWTNFTPSSTALITAFYCQKTEVTDEITTYAVDWGEDITTSSGNTNISSLNDTYALLDFAVKYPSSGDLTPSLFANAKTVVYNGVGAGDYAYSTDGKTRIVKEIFAEDTSNYEVYMITVTESDELSVNAKNLSSSTSVTYDSDNEKVVWVLSEADLSSDYQSADKQYTGFHIGGDPVVPAVYVAKQHGYLVTYYVRAKAADTNLTVHYLERKTTGDAEFYWYDIAVSGNTVFDEDFKQKETNSTELENNIVVNNLGREQTVLADLKNVTEIKAMYRYVDYTCVEVKRSDDGKDVYLYYTFTNSNTFVVDFGIPVQIPLSKLNEQLDGATITGVTFDGVRYGKAEYDANTKTITYSLTTPLSQMETISVKVTGVKNSNSDSVSYIVNIIPATSVYYEDSFATFTDGSDNAKWESVSDGVEQTSTTQALEALGSKTNVYGTDSAYSNSTKYSMGSAHKVTVNSTMADTTGVTWPTASFTFTGTGFDIISLTDNNSGAIYVDVYSGSTATGTPVKRLVVNNYYGYTYDSAAGTWNVSSSGTNNALYQIPVMKVSGLNHGTYTAVITVAYASRQDKTNDSEYSFWLDAIRVYNPMANNDATYAKDGEGYPQYIKLHDELVKTTSTTDSSIVDTTTNKVFFIDGAAEAEVATYANYGPNNEVYLTNGQAITFAVASSDNIASIQIGAKAPNGTAANMNVKVDSNDATNTTINSATEMYYDITSSAKAGKQVTISNNGDGILSLTNLKITYTEDPSTTTTSDSSESPAMLTALSDDEVNTAVMSVRALFAAPVVETFEPETFEASWNSVRKGQTATLTVKTSEDVESIMVDGVAVAEYNTVTERNGFGWWAEKVTYRVFTYQVTADETQEYTITAFNADDVESESITATLTVKESGNSWWSNLWNNFFGRWF